MDEEPIEQTGSRNTRQTNLITTAWKESGKVYGYANCATIFLNQEESGRANRIAHTANLAGIKAQIGYKRLPRASMKLAAIQLSPWPHPHRRNHLAKPV